MSLSPRGVELTALGVVGVHNVLVTRLIPTAAYVPANLGAAALVAAIGRGGGVSLKAQGLLIKGVRIGSIGAALVATVVAAASRHPRLHGRFVDDRVAVHGPVRFAYEVVVRIPLGTALAEEAMFRGTLLALSRRRRSWLATVAYNALWFGLWHVLPTIERARARGEGRPGPGQIAASVAGTAAAGVVFAALRRHGGGVVAPALVHASANISALVATRPAATRRGRCTGRTSSSPTCPSASTASATAGWRRRLDISSSSASGCA